MKKKAIPVEDKNDVETNPKNATPWLKRFWRLKRGKAVIISLGVIVVLAIIMAIPVTRYATTSWIVKKQITLTVVSVADGSPVSNAMVKLGDSSATTNESGQATLSSPVGPHTLTIEKKYYADYSGTYTVPLVFAADASEFELTATGRELSLNVTDTITGKAVANASISVVGLDTSAETDGAGIASVVVPVGTQALTLSLKADDYNTIEKTIPLSDKDSYSTTMTTNGYVYYLSKASGKIDVKKSHLDGTDSKVVLKATGTESDYNTSLLSSRDWAYSTLTANRDGNEGIYLINAKDDSLTTVDEGNASFTPIGWNGHKFYYQVYRENREYWQSKDSAIKVYDADQDQLITLDENKANDDVYNQQYQTFTEAYILDNELFYGRQWNTDYYTPLSSDRKQELVSVDVATNKATVVKSFPANVDTILGLAPYEPQAVYVRVSSSDKPSYYEYENGELATVSGVTDQTFYSNYSSYLLSPDGKKIFWYEQRDGKNYLFLADADGKNEKTLVKSSDYKTYGWFTDDYLLLSKNGSELYISTVDTINKPIKITDFHKVQGVGGYGYGYGGVY